MWLMTEPRLLGTCRPEMHSPQRPSLVPGKPSEPSGPNTASLGQPGETQRAQGKRSSRSLILPSCLPDINDDTESSQGDHQYQTQKQITRLFSAVCPSINMRLQVCSRLLLWTSIAGASSLLSLTSNPGTLCMTPPVLARGGVSSILNVFHPRQPSVNCLTSQISRNVRYQGRN